MRPLNWRIVTIVVVVARPRSLLLNKWLYIDVMWTWIAHDGDAMKRSH